MTEIGIARSKPWVPALICAALTPSFAPCFAQTFTFEALNFDDDPFITENPHLAASLSRAGVTWAFTSNLTPHDPTVEYWEPLTLISRLADVQLADRTSIGSMASELTRLSGFGNSLRLSAVISALSLAANH